MDRFLESKTTETKVVKFNKRSDMLAGGEIAEACANAEKINPEGSALVFNNLPLLESKFSFDAVLQQIIATSPVASHLQPDEVATSKTNLLDSLLQSYTKDSASNQGVAMELDLRPDDAALANDGQLFSDMKPLGLFNRIDLADRDGKHCGEYRIAFGRIAGSESDINGNSNSNNNNRFLMIFEGQYPNPQPELGLAGCAPVVNYWASLDGLSDEKAVVELHKFFMTGTVQDGVTLPAVVNYQNYSADRGQVRVNSIVLVEGPTPNLNQARWQLREFKTAIGTEDNSVEFSHVTVKANPLAELYAYSTSTNTEAFNALSDSFKQDFVTNMLPQLLAPELKGKTSPSDIINGIFLDNDDKYNEFQSNSETPIDETDAINVATVSENFLSDQMINDFINERTQQSGVNHGITREMVINRANAMTCQGCHMTALAQYVAPGLTWPLMGPGGFVQISERENGALSTALKDQFLPARKGVMENFICNPPAVASK
ncbi:hypothetical protein EDC56_3569 [Sinobacterium caligoides]|uniref:Uncharacterized protein n=2 Tax=Sinobacterium caligoides TaxID=933926 RepID=A0A3N2DDM7_9GAMM|nr:hypothetical protein EDC56_3569 [Sinobacterium caligoides]